MARKSRKNVQATPTVVVGAIQYKVALYARISVENEQKREADTIGNQIALLKDFVSQHQDLVVFDLYCDDDISGVSFVRPEFSSNDERHPGWQGDLCDCQRPVSTGSKHD